MDIRSAFDVPALSDVCGSHRGHQSGWPEAIEHQPDSASKEKAAWVARYFDAVNFARLVKIPARVAVGFSDNCCPPWGGYAFFNALKSADKDIYNGIGMWHATYPEFEKAGEAWLHRETSSATAADSRLRP